MVAHELDSLASLDTFDTTDSPQTLTVAGDDVWVVDGADRIHRLSSQLVLAETVEGVRRFSRDLRPIYLEDLGFIPALEMLTREADQEGALSVSFSAAGEVRRLHPNWNWPPTGSSRRHSTTWSNTRRQLMPGSRCALRLSTSSCS